MNPTRDRFTHTPHTADSRPSASAFAPAIALLFALVMSACDSAEPTRIDEAAVADVNPTATGTPVPTPQPEPEPESGFDSGQAPAASTPLDRPWTGDLDVIEEKRLIRILTVYGPGRYYLDGPERKGIVAELATRFEDHLNKKLERGEIRLYAMVIPMARDQLIPALLEGRGDIIAANMTITPERREQVDFSIPVSKPLNEILVTGPSAPPVETLDDLAGQTVYLRDSSSYRESVEALSRDLESRGLEPIRIHSMPGALEDDDLIEMVNAGLLPWAVVDDYKPQLWEGVFTEIEPRDDLVFRRGGRTAWAFRKNSPLLAETVNAFLKKNRQGTLIGNILVNRYIRDFDWAANALGDEDYKRFEELEDIFRKYGEVYGIEHLFAAAQGYQESRLDQSVRSSAGAVGIMQLLPATAADKNVGISGIDKTEPNIHAGIKYMDFLRDRYFSDPEITPLNQALLALGAYNAGPARMIRMRAKAAERGYDPNVWFDNVELIAAEEIGRETVQYVSNIYRYYLSYRMIARQELQRAAARRDAGVSGALDP